MTIKTRDLLVGLGFTEEWTAMTDRLPAYQYNFGNFVLSAAQLTTNYLRPSMYLSGIISTARSITEVGFDMPMEVDSYEQGVAFIAHAVGRTFVPAKPTHWLDDGRSWEEYLPWVRERKEYEARPQCYVHRDWFRVANKKLRKLSAKATDEDYVEFFFDGEVLRMAAAQFLGVVPATGQAWAERYRVPTKSLHFLPQRLLDEEILVHVWQDRLGIAGRIFQMPPTVMQLG